jgi:hypothetical protein
MTIHVARLTTDQRPITYRLSLSNGCSIPDAGSQPEGHRIVERKLGNSWPEAWGHTLSMLRGGALPYGK